MSQDKSIKPRKGSKVEDFALLTIEAALNLIPYAGSFLATYFGEVRSQRATERVYKYINYLRRSLEEMGNKKVDVEYMKTEEFAELVAQGADLAAKSAAERKIRRFANIIANHVMLDFKFRSRTQSIMSFVDRLSDLDAFMLISYGPTTKSFRAETKDEAFDLVIALSKYLGQECPSREEVIESIIYLDNLGLTWVNEKFVGVATEKGEDLVLKEFSSFRTPLGKEVVKVMVPPDFFKVSGHAEFSKIEWPSRWINIKYKHGIPL